jgi:heat shock protein HslJ
MNKFIAWCFLIIILVSGGVYLYRNNLDKNVEISQSQEEIELIDRFYISENQKEAWVTFAGNDVFVSIIDTEYENVSLQKVEVDSGEKYENKEIGMVLLNNNPEINVYKNDELIFFGKERELVLYEKLINNVWVWNKTYIGSGPDLDLNNSIKPKKIDAFTIQFTKDGQVSGTTDCNNFNGTYELKEGEISFGPFATTKKFCADSQEAEFLAMLKEGVYSIGDQNFYIENEQTVVFNIKN